MEKEESHVYKVTRGQFFLHKFYYSMSLTSIIHRKIVPRKCYVKMTKNMFYTFTGIEAIANRIPQKADETG